MRPSRLGQRFEHAAPVGVLRAQQRSAVELQDVEGPELDAGGARAVLHLAEVRHAGLVECDDFAVEDHVMVGEIGGERLELGIFVGDVAAAAANAGCSSP